MIKLMTKRAITGPERKPFKIPSIHNVHAQTIRLGLHTISLGSARPRLSVPVIPTKRK